MKRIIQLITLSVVVLAGCVKEKEVYTPGINQSIQSQSASMLVLYDVVNIHSAMITGASNYNQFEGCCFDRSSYIDTLSGAIHETIQVNGSSCQLGSEQATSGEFTATYNPGFPAIGEKVVLKLNQLITNGLTFSGILTYWYFAPNVMRVETDGITVTDVHGTSTLTALLQVFGTSTGLELSGSMKSTGTNTYSWRALTGITNASTYAGLKTGTAEFTCEDKLLTQNFGNGEDDKFTTFEDETEVRKVLILPKLKGYGE